MDHNFIKQVVTHISFGQGTIVDCRDQIISVRFSDGEKRFRYPEAFEKYVSFENTELQEKALIDLQKNKELKELAVKKAAMDVELKRSKQTNFKKRTPPHYQGKKMTYKEWEESYPEYVIIQKEGFMYTAHNKSAEVLGAVLDYELITDAVGRLTTGGPDGSKIGFALENNNTSYIIIEYGVIVDQYDAK